MASMHSPNRPSLRQKRGAPKRLQAMIAAALALTFSAAYAFSVNNGQANSPTPNHPSQSSAPMADDETVSEAQLATAIFAGGCFWCVEADFDKVTGVVETISGYTGGTVDAPTYQQVSKETTGHYEAVRVTFDPERVTYRALVDYFFRHVDPLDAGGQFCDRGASYRTAIFTHGAQQEQAAKAGKKAAEEALGKAVVTPVLPAQTFWQAETYHQDYYLKKPTLYKIYRSRCGRDARIKRVWSTAKPL